MVVSLLLVLGLIFCQRKKVPSSQKSYESFDCLSVLFLLSYIAHHLLAESTVFGGEGSIKSIYYFILVTHIILAGLSLTIYFIYCLQSFNCGVRKT
jgi:putative membrane protein